MNIFIDIETIPEQPEGEAKARIASTIQAPTTMKKPETISAWHSGEGKYAGVKDDAIEDAYRKTSFDGAKGEIISIAWALENGDINSEGRGFIGNEPDLLKNFFCWIKYHLKGRKPFFIGHYIGGFDLKFLFHRAVILGVNPGFDLKQNGRHGSDYYDTMVAWAGYKDKISQDNLCKAFGIEGKPDDIDGSKVWDFVKAGDIEKVVEYNKDDVKKVREIYRRMNFITEG